MIDFEHYRDAISASIDEAYNYLQHNPQANPMSAVLCLLEAMQEVRNLLDELVENNGNNQQ